MLTQKFSMIAKRCHELLVLVFESVEKVGGEVGGKIGEEERFHLHLRKHRKNLTKEYITENTKSIN